MDFLRVLISWLVVTDEEQEGPETMRLEMVITVPDDILNAISQGDPDSNTPETRTQP